MESPEDGAGARGIIDHNGKLTRHEQAQLPKAQKRGQEPIVRSTLWANWLLVPGPVSELMLKICRLQSPAARVPGNSSKPRGGSEFRRHPPACGWLDKHLRHHRVRG